MIEALCLIVLGLPAYLFWAAGRDAAEAAVVHGRRACERAGVQWLDQSVHLVRLRLRRHSSGWLRWERQFRFEYSSAGQDRQAGLVIMLGSSLTGLVGPMPAAETLH